MISNTTRTTVPSTNATTIPKTTGTTIPNTTATTVPNFGETIPRFSSDEIFQVIKQKHGVFKAQRDYLDDVSHDIKTLEDYMQKHCALVPFEYDLKDKTAAEIGCFSQLSWKPDANGRFRLFTESGEIVPNSLNGDVFIKKEVSHARPLVEDTAWMRTQVYPILPKFLSAFVEKLSKYGLS